MTLPKTAYEVLVTDVSASIQATNSWRVPAQLREHTTECVHDYNVMRSTQTYGDGVGRHQVDGTVGT